MGLEANSAELRTIPAHPAAVASGTAARRLNFPTIDVLRGFAAISVMVMHVIALINWTEFPRTWPLLWFRHGGVGVDLFLVTSGFVIFLSARSLLGRHTFGDYLVEFGKRRFLRIVPLYLLTGVVFLVLVAPALMQRSTFWQHALVHLLFIHNMFPGSHGSIDGPNWSVGLEVQFYVLIALLTPVLRRCHWLTIVMVSLAVGWAWRSMALAAIPIETHAANDARFMLATQLPGTLDEFAVGVLLARLLTSAVGERLLAWCRHRWWVPVSAALLAMACAMTILAENPEIYLSVGMTLFWRTGMALSCGLLVFAACCLDHPVFLAWTAPLRYLGTLSYGIYLWHLIVIGIVVRFPDLARSTSLCIVLAVTFMLAMLSWHLVEQPIMNRGNAAIGLRSQTG